MYSVVVNTLQGLSKYKLVITTVLIGLFINTVLDVPFMLIAYKLGYEVSHGAVIAAVTGYTVSIIISLFTLHYKYGFSFSDTRKKLPKYVISWLVFEVIIVILKMFVPTTLQGRLIQIPILGLFGLVSFGIYFLINSSYYHLNS